jgi:hypothetical protein
MESAVGDGLRKEARVTSGPGVSATGRGGKGAARVSWASGRLAGLGPGGKRGGEKWAARCRAAEEKKARPKPKRRGNPFLFPFSNFPKHFSKKILNPLLNLIQTTQFKISNAAV